MSLRRIAPLPAVHCLAIACGSSSPGLSVAIPITIPRFASL
jgi:hypothetical protein